ncbi:hypothetical protein CHUAL_012151 [Chamberlinius hualienensis]
MLVFFTILIASSSSNVYGDVIGCLHPNKNFHVISKITPNQIHGLFPVDSIIKYSCDKGFEILNNQTRHCLSNGQWSGEEPYCGIDVARLATAEFKTRNSMGWPWKSLCTSIKLGQAVWEVTVQAVWSFKWNRTYSLNVVQVAFKTFDVSVGHIPQLHYSTENEILNVQPLTLINYTRYQSGYVVYQFLIENPAKSTIIHVQVDWPVLWEVCNFGLYTDSALPDSWCSFKDQFNVKHFSYDDKCFAVFGNHVNEKWPKVLTNCQSYKTHLNSSMAFLRSKDFIDYFAVIVRNSPVYQRYFWLHQPAGDSKYYFVDMETNIVYKRASPYGESGQICEYNYPRCGNPDQITGTLFELDETFANYFCPQNYLLNGTETRICRNGKWTSDAPTCILNDVQMSPSSDVSCKSKTYCYELTKKVATMIAATVGAILLVLWTLTGAALIYFRRK